MALQNSSARYYQRPDVNYVRFDSARSELSGYGGRVKVGKGSKGLWRYSSELNWRSPGLDLNDIGFMQTADIIKLGNSISYFVNQPVGIFRTYSVGLNETSNWDFGLRYLSSSIGTNLYFEFLNQWAISDRWRIRGRLWTHAFCVGSAMLVPAIWSISGYARTDPSARAFFDCTVNFAGSDRQSSRFSSVQPEVTLMPFNTLKFSASISYTSSLDNLQYVGTASVTNETKYILARISQKSLGATFRIDYHLTPEISLQYYGVPLLPWEDILSLRRSPIPMLPTTSRVFHDQPRARR